MRQALRRAIAGVSPAASTAGIRVLMYHAIDEPDAADRLSLRVSRRAFEDQMRLLHDEDFSVVPLTQLLDPPDDVRLRVAITFDDGYQSQAWAAEVLRHYRFPATFFLVPRFLEGVREPSVYWEQWGHMPWEGAASLIRDGFEVGAHSATHPDLRTCADRQLDEELSGAKALLETRLGREVVSFSYPYGRHDSRVRLAVERAGYRLACTSRYGPSRSAATSYAFPRTEVTSTDSLTDFIWKLRGKYDWLRYWQDLRMRA